MRRPRHLLSLLLCLVLPACSDSKSPTQPTPPETNEVFYTAVGASDAIGFGGSTPCVPFTDCPNGTGYVQTLTRRLQATGKTVTVLNLGIPGAVLNASLQSLGNELGRGIPGNFIEREAPFVPRNSTLITVFAGGNDINTVANAVLAGRGGNDPAAYVAQLTRDWGNDLRSMIGTIRGRAPNARIIALNLPNFAGLPLAQSYTLDQKRGLQQIAVGFSAQVNALASNGVIVIDLMCDAQSYIAGNYSGDGFHPNDRGYAFITDAIWPAASGGSTPPPMASCGPMNMF